MLFIAVGAWRIAVLAITTKGEVDGWRELSIPMGVATAIGLPRASKSAILVDEANIFECVGFDMHPVPGKTVSCFGRSLPGFVIAARNRFFNAGRPPIAR